MKGGGDRGLKWLSPRTGGHWWLVLAGSMVVSTGIAAASYDVLERRVLRFKDWRPRRGLTEPEASVPTSG